MAIQNNTYYSLMLLNYCFSQVSTRKSSWKITATIRTTHRSCQLTHLSVVHHSWHPAGCRTWRWSRWWDRRGPPATRMPPAGGWAWSPSPSQTSERWETLWWSLRLSTMTGDQTSCNSWNHRFGVLWAVKQVLEKVHRERQTDRVQREREREREREADRATYLKTG